MNSKKYKLTMLPIFKNDFEEIINYIGYDLNNPSAARRLFDDAMDAILKRLENPLSFAPYKSSKLRKNPYYRINVRNYSIFYVVIGDTMEVRRILYSKRNLDNFL